MKSLALSLVSVDYSNQTKPCPGFGFVLIIDTKPYAVFGFIYTYQTKSCAGDFFFLINNTKPYAGFTFVKTLERIDFGSNFKDLPLMDRQYGPILCSLRSS